MTGCLDDAPKTIPDDNHQRCGLVATQTQLQKEEMKKEQKKKCVVYKG